MMTTADNQMETMMCWLHLNHCPDWIGDACGYLASGLVLATFSMKSMRHLRMTAIASNVAFLLYAITLHLRPVMMLHGILLPLNIFRLAQIERARAAGRRMARGDAGAAVEAAACRSDSWHRTLTLRQPPPKVARQ